MTAAGKRVIVFGASGTIGRATVHRLLEAGYAVTAVSRKAAGAGTRSDADDIPGATYRSCDFADPLSVARDAFGECGFDVVISCLASRTGERKDAWFVDYEANMQVLAAAKSAGVGQMILISAICVQKPALAFQHAKLAFEQQLVDSGLTYSIIRPTAFFKSLSGQIDRVKSGKPFLVFGDGRLTRCKPISDADLARYICECIEDPDRQDRILQIGGPGPAISPLEQGEKLFELLGEEPRFRHVPVKLLDVAASLLGVVGKLFSRAERYAEYMRIARYYATESMLVFDHEAGRYDEQATPETGSDTLFDHYAKSIASKP